MKKVDFIGKKFFVLLPSVIKVDSLDGDEFNDLYETEIITLRIISRNLELGNRMTVSDISELVGVTKSAVSQIISSLEDKGYIYKVKSDEDKRRMYLALTERGEKIAEAINGLYNRRLNYIRKNFGEEEFDEFVRLFIKYIELCDSIDWKNVKI